MRKLTVLLLLFLPFTSIFANNSIDIFFASPQANQPSDSSLYVSVNVTSTFQISTVIADVQGHQASLAWDIGSQTFIGYVNLSGLPKGVSLLLTVTATDVFNTQQSASQNFIYVPPPVLSIIAPIQYSNASPAIHVKAESFSIDTCTLKVEVIFGATLFVKNYTSTVDTTIIIQASQGAGYVRYTATDRWGQSVSDQSAIFFNDNIYLNEVFSGPDLICDFNYGRVLTAPINNNFEAEGTMIDLSTQSSALLPGFYIREFGGAYVTPFGAFSDAVNAIYEWNNGTLYTFNKPTGLTAGIYDSYKNSDSIFLRNMNTQVTTLVTADTLGKSMGFGCLGSDGTVAYAILDNYTFIDSFYKYKNGLYTGLGPAPHGRSYMALQTDSGYVVHMTLDLSNGWENYIYLHDGSSYIQLSYLGEYGALGLPTPDPYNYASFYGISGKSVAFIRFDATNEYQIWLRDSTGAISQRSFFSTSSSIDAVNSRGDIMYINGGRRWLAKAGTLQPPVDCGTAVGRAVYRDAEWYIITTTRLYKLLLDAYTTVANGNWDDPATWANGIVPPPNANVIILNNVIVNVNVTCNTLNVHSPGSVTVLPGITLTILH